MEFSHIPVLLQPCLDGLNIDPAGIYLDGTAGGAGHSREIAKRLTTGRLISLDQDPDAVAVATERLKGVLHGQFSANIATGTEFTVDKPDMYLSEKNIHESEDGAPEPGTPDTPDTDTKGGDAE